MKRRLFACLVSAFLATFVGEACSGMTAFAPPTGEGESPDLPNGMPTADSGPPAVPGAGTAKFVVTNETLVVSGATREYVLARPRAYDTHRKLPLVMVLHGDGGDGASMRTWHPIHDETDGEAFVVYPSGHARGWDLYTPSDANVDTRFIVALVDALTSRFPIDPDRLFGTGYSSGGFYLNQLACRRDVPLRGMAVHAGGAPFEEPGVAVGTFPNGFVRCSEGQTKVAAIIVHGQEDTTVAVESGEFASTYWAYVDGCENTRHLATPEPCEAYDACPVDSPVLFCLVPGLGHTIWSKGAKAAWDFFRAL